MENHFVNMHIYKGWTKNYIKLENREIHKKKKSLAKMFNKKAVFADCHPISFLA